MPRKAVQLRWENWGDICDLVPSSQFIRGTYLDQDGFPTSEISFKEDRLGLLIRDSKGNALVAKENQWLVKNHRGEVEIK